MGTPREHLLTGARPPVRFEDIPPTESWPNLKIWRNSNGEEHRDGDLPAFVSDSLSAWYQHGIRCRADDKPSVVWADGTQEWRLDREYHRDGDQPVQVDADGGQHFGAGYDYSRADDRPTYIDGEGNEFWRRGPIQQNGYPFEGELHRDGDLPAVVRMDGGVEYWKNGKKHRDSEPAVVKANGTQQWWFHGDNYRNLVPLRKVSE